MNQQLTWNFPLPRTHTGMLLGNGTMGAMVWGAGSTLRITLNRADFWDHRGGNHWTADMSYGSIRKLLLEGNSAALDKVFGKTPPPPGLPARPSVLPLGRLELTFEGWTLDRGELDTSTGTASVVLRKGSQEARVELCQAMDRPVISARWDAALGAPAIKPVTSWDYVGKYLDSIGFTKPEVLAEPGLCGWVVARPADPAACIGWRVDGPELLAGVTYGGSPAEARQATKDLLGQAHAGGTQALVASARAWWSDYNKRLPVVDVPHEGLKFLYQYGMYKFAGLTNPAGVPATLQGPWVEECQMPPWSSDYHFNINVQMCYWPAYPSGLLDHLPPLFDLIEKWMPQLRENARLFVGIDDGLVLPHAVDDRGTIMGGFWTGTIDHGCTAWVAKMMYDYWLYTGDREFLRKRAWPFMVGAMRVYEEMLERRDGAMSLPLSVSPEYRGAAMNAWGANASFQLAAIHWLAEALMNAAGTLGLEPREIWSQIRQKLPKASLIEAGKGKQMIALWDGTPLEESHRHHSHLAGLYPFDTINATDAKWSGIVANSLSHWIYRGMGLWSGWCMPWAAMLHARAGNPDMAVTVLELWQKVFTNEGHGTLHDCNFAGLTLMGAGKHDPNKEIMQMDAGMGAVTAVMDLLLQSRRGVVYLFAGAPLSWRSVGFERLCAEGGFRVSARREKGKVRSVTIESPVGGTLRLANPFGGPAVTSNGMRLAGDTLEIATMAGERIEVSPVA